MTDIADITAKYRRLESARHSAELDLNLAMHGFKNKDFATAQQMVEVALERLYRERPDTVRPAAAPSGLLEQVRAHVHRFTSDKAA